MKIAIHTPTLDDFIALQERLIDKNGIQKNSSMYMTYMQDSCFEIDTNTWEYRVLSVITCTDVISYSTLAAKNFEITIEI